MIHTSEAVGRKYLGRLPPQVQRREQLVASPRKHLQVRLHGADVIDNVHNDGGLVGLQSMM